MDTTTGYLAVSAAGLVALAYTLVNYLRSVVNLRDQAARSACVAQSISYAVFVAIVFLAGRAEDTFGEVHFVPNTTLSNMDSASKVMLGLVLGGAGGLVHKFLQARDNTDTAQVPSFTAPPATPEPPG